MIMADILAEEHRTQVGEMIGRTGTAGSSYTFAVAGLYPPRPSIDWTRADYLFWGRFRRNMEQGYQLGGLFGPPIAHTMLGWIFGIGATVTDGENKFLNEELQNLFETEENKIYDWLYDAFTLGDGYIVVNPDATFDIIPPDRVAVVCDPANHNEVIGYVVTTLTQVVPASYLSPQTLQNILPQDNQSYLITEVFTREFRYRQVKRGSQVIEEQTFANPTNEFAIIHFANGRETNEVYGHPIYEHLLFLFARYDNVLNKSLDAAEIMGHPIPVAEGLDNPQQAKTDNATSTRTGTDVNGQAYSETVVDFSRAGNMLWLGTGASFKFASPDSFTGDAGNLMEYLFLLMLQSCFIPEWAWGGAIKSSFASVDSQMPGFERHVERWRNYIRPGLIQMVKVWVAWKAIVDRRYRVKEQLAAKFPAVVPKDQQLQFQKIQYADARNWITDETGLRALDLVEDPEMEVKRAHEQAIEQMGQFDAAMQAQIDQLGQTGMMTGEAPDTKNDNDGN